MRRACSSRALAVAAVAIGFAAPVSAAMQAPLLQTDISASQIRQVGNSYSVDLTVLASDFEEMFAKAARVELKGVDLAAPGILELEIGNFVAKRIVIRDREGKDCAGKVERAGEDPANDEGVKVSLTFECASADVLYDPSRFLAAHGPRAWQVVTIIRGATQKQIMLNAESQPAPLAGQ